MNKIKSLIVSIIFIVSITACSNNDPGPLAGSWEIRNTVMPMVFQFRNGEAESMGMIEKVTYKKDGNSVIVTSKNGIAKGVSMRYRIINKDTLQAGPGLMHRIK